MTLRLSNFPSLCPARTPMYSCCNEFYSKPPSQCVMFGLQFQPHLFQEANVTARLSVSPEQPTTCTWSHACFRVPRVDVSMCLTSPKKLLKLLGTETKLWSQHQSWDSRDTQCLAGAEGRNVGTASESWGEGQCFSSIFIYFLFFFILTPNMSKGTQKVTSLTEPWGWRLLRRGCLPTPKVEAVKRTKTRWIPRAGRKWSKSETTQSHLDLLTPLLASHTPPLSWHALGEAAAAL